MFVFKVLAHPLNKVILEYPLDELVKQIWSNELVDISVGKIVSERLDSDEFESGTVDRDGTHSNIIDNTIRLPQYFWIECSLACTCVFGQA